MRDPAFLRRSSKQNQACESRQFSLAAECRTVREESLGGEVKHTSVFFLPENQRFPTLNGIVSRTRVWAMEEIMATKTKIRIANRSHNGKLKAFPAPRQLATPTDLKPTEVRAVVETINPLVADAFALYV